jgi:hypothetical protein
VQREATLNIEKEKEEGRTRLDRGCSRRSDHLIRPDDSFIVIGHICALTHPKALSRSFTCVLVVLVHAKHFIEG